MISYLKKSWYILIVVVISIILSGCGVRRMENEDYELAIIDAVNKKIAVGDIEYIPKRGEVFIPYTIDGYTVGYIGIPSSFKETEDMNNWYVKRIYFPSTIKKILHQYLTRESYTEYRVFFCNKAINLYNLIDGIEPSDLIKIYVPSEYYEKYLKINKQYPIYKANVCYYFNLEENDYYYVDYYEEDSLIEFIPPNPEKEGYIFDGWYKEKECINKWDFESDTVKLEENIEEIKLYAKWIVE